jgi:diguanylate cyclase (GGDEF)-like protein
VDSYAPLGALTRGRRHVLAVLALIAGVAATGLVVEVALHLAGRGLGGSAELALAAQAAGAAACLLRALWIRPERAIWLCVGIGTALWTAAWSDFAVTGGTVDVRTVGLADMLWGAAYPGWFVAIWLATRGRVGRHGPGAWLDGLVGALAAAAITAATVVQALVVQPESTILTLVFPALDALIIGMLATTLARAGWRLSRSGVLLGAGLIALVVGNSVHAVVCATWGYLPGRPYEALWALGILLLGGAAWAPAERAARSSEAASRLGLVFPCTFAGIALGALVWGAAADLNFSVIAFSAAALVMVLARLLVTLRETSALAESRRLSLTDEVTGGSNRRALLAAAQEAVDAGRTFSLLMLDLDRFKELNDTLGHPAGDEALRAIAQRLRVAAGPSAAVGRLGGDEFGLVVRGGRARAERTAAAIAEALTTPLPLEGIQVPVAASVGIALYPQHGRDVSALLRGADVAMYEAKRGGGSHRVYAARSDPHSRERLELSGELGPALARGELTLRYQPVVSLSSGEVTSVEALVRWQHPERGELGPGAFLPAVERTSFMRRITAYVLDRALADAAGPLADLGVAVNVAPQDVHDPGFAADVAARLAEHGVEPGRLTLEITETAVLADPEQAAATLCELRKIGVRVALDDFGTGYSSLTHLHRLPVDVVKIDRSFVGVLGTDGPARAIVRSTVVLAHALGASVVAEGVESPEALLLARANGCDAAQGFDLARPSHVAEIPRLCAEISARLGNRARPLAHVG